MSYASANFVSNQPRQSNGEFGPKVNTEAADVKLLGEPTATAEPTEFPELDEVRDRFMANGASEAKARALTSSVLAMNYTTMFRDESKDALARGNSTRAAMTMFALQAFMKVPTPVSEADENPEAAKAAIDSARRSLDTHDSLFGPFNPGSTEPILAAAKKALDDVDSYLNLE